MSEKGRKPVIIIAFINKILGKREKNVGIN